GKRLIANCMGFREWWNPKTNKIMHGLMPRDEDIGYIKKAYDYGISEIKEMEQKIENGEVPFKVNIIERINIMVVGKTILLKMLNERRNFWVEWKKDYEEKLGGGIDTPITFKVFLKAQERFRKSKNLAQH
ncbi:MAG: hypothetical protein KKE71_04125, partial [Nanoarchaeota archaeon]|nr:hypothetical protein [Nanoarchaeota archaeon]